MSEAISPEIKEDCPCLEGNFYYLNFETTHLGGDAYTGEVEILTCKLCGRHWLRIFYEPGMRDDDDKWYIGLIDEETIASIAQGDVLQNARTYLEALDWFYIGGSYWSAIGRRVPFKTRGDIILWS